jgi:iron complex outermembrane receptor protein
MTMPSFQFGPLYVDGIINIITRPTRDTRGVFVKAGTGSNEKAAGSFRAGGKLGQAAFGRVYAKFFERNPFESTRIPRSVTVTASWKR